MSLLQALVSVLSAVVGGFVGGWTVAFRLGRWRQRVEDRLDAIDARLAEGDPHVGAVPVIQARLSLVLEELRSLRREMREDIKQLVTREECDRRHGDG